MKKEFIKKILMLVMGIILSASMILGTVNLAYHNEVKLNSFYNIYSTLKYSFIDYPFEFIKDIGSNLVLMWDAVDENKQLKEQLAKNDLLSNEVDILRRENADLLDMLNLDKSISAYNLISTALINRNVETYNNTILINVGEDDGVVKDFAVINSEGLIGKVVSTTKNTSIVKLLTTTDNSNQVSISIKIDESTYVDAIMERYDYETGCYIAKLLVSNNSITKDMSVISSGMGQVFPKGLLVGNVKSIENIEDGIGMKLYIEPIVNFSNLDYLYVVSREVYE